MMLALSFQSLIWEGVREGHTCRRLGPRLRVVNRETTLCGLGLVHFPLCACFLICEVGVVRIETQAGEAFRTLPIRCKLLLLRVVVVA